MSNVAVERALILLRYIIDNPDGLSIREASRNLGYSPATVQKLVKALEIQGYVVQDDLTERYHLGSEAVQLGLAALARLEVRRIARPHLEALSHESGETVFLGIAHGDHAIYIDKVVSDEMIRMDAPLGVTRPYNCTAVGKVLLSHIPPDELKRLAKADVFEQRTQHSKTKPQALLPELKQIRKQGWAQDREEFSPGAMCVAAPVRNFEGKVIAALTVSGPAERIDRKFDQMVEQVVAKAASISAEIGYRHSQK
jgi:DNA-binding IclR family transcriptional regulator